MQLSEFAPSAFQKHANHEAICKILAGAAARESGLLHEFEAYELFTLIGMGLPAFHYFPLGERLVEEISGWMQADKKYVVKCHIPGCLHKTDIGGIMLFQTRETVKDSVPSFCEKLKAAGHVLEGVIVPTRTGASGPASASAWAAPPWSTTRRSCATRTPASSCRRGWTWRRATRLAPPSAGSRSCSS